MNNLLFKTVFKNKSDFIKLISCNLALALILGFQVKIIDKFFHGISMYLSGNLSVFKFSLYVLIFAGIILLNPVINSYFTYICKVFEEESLIYIKEMYYKKLSKEEPINFQSVNFLNEQTEIKNGINYFLSYIMSLFDAMIVYLVYFIIVIAYLVNLKKELVIIPILLSIPAILIHTYNYKLSDKTNTVKSKTDRKIQNYFNAMVGTECHKETRIKYLTNFFMKKYKDSIKELNNIEYNYTLKSVRVELIFKLIFTLSYIFSISILFFYAYNKQISVYSMSSIIISMELLKSMIDEFIGYALPNISKNYGNSKAFIIYMKTEKEYRKIISLKSAPSITLENVCFKYPKSSNMTLKNINLSIKNGEFIAIVGKNGSGKTTLTKLIQGLYIPTDGSVKFQDLTDNYSSKEYKTDSISSLFQNFKKYKLDLFTNISISEEYSDNSSKKKVLNVMKKINFKFDKDIYAKGIYTMLSKDFNGTDISIGQWQRIAILRCLYKNNAKILCLDEPTSAIDPIEEDFFYETFKHFSKDKTCIMVTHRMASLKYANRIIYLEDGKIVGFSTHKNLMKIPKYKKMFNSQANLYK